MCRIGAIKSRGPIHPSKALYLMLPQQEGHDNSGYDMVMQDLYGVFERYKDKPLLSLACTPRGAQMVSAHMEEKRFTQLVEGVPGVDRRPASTSGPCPVRCSARTTIPTPSGPRARRA